VHDVAAQERRPLTVQGISAHSDGTLVDRALEFLADGPAGSDVLAREVMGLARAPGLVAERIAVALLGADPRVLRLSDGRWALAHVKLGSPALRTCAFAVVDVETTGTRPSAGDRIVEIAIAVVVGDHIDLVLDQLVNPECPISRFTTSLTNITASMVADQPTFGEIADEVMGALAGRTFVAHNARFDWRFVTRELRRARDLVLDGPQICTVQLTRRLVPALRPRGLDSVATYFGIEIADRHRAAGDAVATAKVLRCLIGLAEEQGAKTLNDLRRLGRRGRRKRTAMPQSMDSI